MTAQTQVAQLVLTSLGTQSESLAINLLADKLGNRNRNKALRLARQIIQEGKVKPQMVNRLAMALSLEPEVFEVAYRADVKAQSEVASNLWFRRVGPHLQVRTKGRRYPLFITNMLFAELKIIRLPDNIDNLTWQEQKQKVRSAINLFKNADWDNDEKKMDKIQSIYGSITGFVYCPSALKSFKFTVEGRFESLNQGVVVPEIGLTIKGKPLFF
jgi:hypothetical protein